MNNKTGELIEKYRKAKGLTQNELAKKLGVSNTAISKWEHGNNLPDITLLEPLSEILGIDKLLLFTSESEETIERNKSIKKSYFIRNSISAIVFLLLLLFTNYISYKVYKQKLNEIKKSNPEIYRFYSQDDEYFVNGYIIFKEDESTIIFDQLSYQARKRTAEEVEITSAELFLYLDGEMILKKQIKTSEEKMNTSTIINQLMNVINQNNIQIENKVPKKSNIKLVINKEKNVDEKIIELEIRKEI